MPARAVVTRRCRVSPSARDAGRRSGHGSGLSGADRMPPPGRRHTGDRCDAGAHGDPGRSGRDRRPHAGLGWPAAQLPGARPRPSRSGPLAAVISLHGGLGTGAAQERLTGLDAIADRSGFVAVYPDGIDRSWADGRGAAPADRLGIDDVAFLADLIAALESRDGVSPGDVFLSGMSNGAFMAQRCACDRPDLVAAIAPVAGTLATPTPCPPSASRPAVSVLEVHGTVGGPRRDRRAGVVRHRLPAGDGSRTVDRGRGRSHLAGRRPARAHPPQAGTMPGAPAATANRAVVETGEVRVAIESTVRASASHWRRSTVIRR